MKNPVDAYFAKYPSEVQEILQKIRSLIPQVAPDAIEKMGYGVPAFWLEHPLVYYAAFAKHIGVYPIPKGNAAFQKKIAPYVKGKGTLQFPLEKPIPYSLIKEVVQWLADESKK